MFEIVRLFMATIEEKHKGIGDYHEFTCKIYDEYFDNRAYLIDQYLDALGRVLDVPDYSLDAFAKTFIEQYIELMK